MKPVHTLRTLCNQNGLSCRGKDGKYLSYTELKRKLKKHQVGGTLGMVALSIEDEKSTDPDILSRYSKFDYASMVQTEADFISRHPTLREALLTCDINPECGGVTRKNGSFELSKDDNIEPSKTASAWIHTEGKKLRDRKRQRKQLEDTSDRWKGDHWKGQSVQETQKADAAKKKVVAERIWRKKWYERIADIKNMYTKAKKQAGEHGVGVGLTWDLALAYATGAGPEAGRSPGDDKEYSQHVLYLARLNGQGLLALRNVEEQQPYAGPRFSSIEDLLIEAVNNGYIDCENKETYKGCVVDGIKYDVMYAETIAGQANFRKVKEDKQRKERQGKQRTERQDKQRVERQAESDRRLLALTPAEAKAIADASAPAVHEALLKSLEQLKTQIGLEQGYPKEGPAVRRGDTDYMYQVYNTVQNLISDGLKETPYLWTYGTNGKRIRITWRTKVRESLLAIAGKTVFFYLDDLGGGRGWKPSAKVRIICDEIVRLITSDGWATYRTGWLITPGY
jgi:hypothetical protein